LQIIFDRAVKVGNRIRTHTGLNKLINLYGMLMIAETTKSLTARLSGLKDEITKNEFEIRSEKQEGDFTFIEAMKS
jgi:hypothetical protein